MVSQPASSDASWGREWLPFVVVVPFVVAALLAVVFEVAREIPPNYGCGEQEPAGLQEQVDAYRQGYIPLHVIGFVASLSALAAISVARMRRIGRSGIGALTGLALALLTALFVGAALSDSVRAVFIVVVFPAIALVVIAGVIGEVATGVLAALLMGVAGVWAARSAASESRLFGASAICWLLLLLIPAHALIVSAQGTGPTLC